MEAAFDLNSYAHSRFRDAFGVPDHTTDHAAQWSLKIGPSRLSDIHLLLHGPSEDGLMLWMFNPNATGSSVINALITHWAEVDAVIVGIRDEVQAAAAAWSQQAA